MTQIHVGKSTCLDAEDMWLVFVKRRSMMVVVANWRGGQGKVSAFPRCDLLTRPSSRRVGHSLSHAAASRACHPLQPWERGTSSTQDCMPMSPRTMASPAQVQGPAAPVPCLPSRTQSRHPPPPLHLFTSPASVLVKKTSHSSLPNTNRWISTRDAHPIAMVS